MTKHVPLSRPRSTATRTQDGRKIDAWVFEFPGGPATFEVRMHSDAQRGIFFDVSTTHPLLAAIHRQGPSLEAIHRDISQAVEDCLAENIGATWVPALILETRSEHRSYGANKIEARLSLTAHPVRMVPPKPGHNGPEVRILDERNVSCDIVQQSASAPIAKPGRIGGLPETISRVVVADNPTTQEQITAIQSVIAHFGGLMEERLAPGPMQSQGLPSKEELREMFERALAAPTEKPDQSSFLV